MAHISLAHGNGGRYMRQLIEEVFAGQLANPILDPNVDAATVPALAGDMMMSVDGFTVKPLEFPGGNIGSLAIHGTVNDLAVSGAIAKYLSLSAIIEEGLELKTLERLIHGMARAADEAGVQIVCGDTKVVPRGEGSGVYFSITGIGERNRDLSLGLSNITAGDSILVSGPVGDHGTAIMLARQQFGLSGDVQSDSANVIQLCNVSYDLPGLRFMRDPTRGGLATVLHEISRATQLGMRIQQVDIPVRDSVNVVCEMLGYDPLYLACEGRVVAVIAEDEAETALERWRALPAGADSHIIGKMDHLLSQVVLETELGGERVLEELEDDPLPRIC